MYVVEPVFPWEVPIQSSVLVATGPVCSRLGQLNRGRRQNSQSAGTGHAGSGSQPTVGRQPGGGSGQPGGTTNAILRCTANNRATMSNSSPATRSDARPALSHA